jgi:hypothetical protein
VPGGQPQQPDIPGGQPNQFPAGQGQGPYPGQPQNPYPGQPQNPYPGQPQNPYPGQPQNAYPGQPQTPYPGQSQYGQGQIPNAYATGQGPSAPSGGAKAAAVGVGFLKTVVGRIVIAVVIAAIAGVIYFVVKPGPAGTKVGECLNITGTTANPDATKVSCDDAKATYVVTAVGATCDEYEDEFTFKTKGATVSKLCLFYNVKVGDCLTVSTTGADSKGVCSPGSYKVTLTKDGTSDDTQCPGESTTSIPNVTRNKLICLAKQK